MSKVVVFEGVSKFYRIGSSQSSLREALSSIPAHMTGRQRTGHPDQNWIWALKDVSFDLEAGEVLGIVGRNGAGKTTALKLLSRVTEPTRGSISVAGRVSALIELGAGFHPDLTGRENVYLNGVILGLTRKEIGRKFDSIVRFAELEKFIDTPVKRYSSGMYARLGFAVAAHSEPDVLLVDEVLAVGDAAFQRRCFDFIHSFVTGGKTAVFVSHNLYVLEQLCDRLVWLDGGEVRMTGTPRDVLPSYLDCIDQQTWGDDGDHASAGDYLTIGPVTFTDRDGRVTDSFKTGDDIIVHLRYRIDGSVETPHFCLGVVGPESHVPLFKASMLVDGQAPARIEGTGTLTCHFGSVPLMPRTYSLWGEVWGTDRRRLVVPWQRLGTFRIVMEKNGHRQDPGMGAIWQTRADAPIKVPYEWGYQTAVIGSASEWMELRQNWTRGGRSESKSASDADFR